jgi:hypothetical protein
MDAVAAGCDAGIRHGEHLAQDVIAVQSDHVPSVRALAAAPAYFQQPARPMHHSDLMDHQSIRLRFSSDILDSGESGA